MVGRVLREHDVVRREGSDYVLPDFEGLTSEEVRELRVLCQAKLADYIERRGEAIWGHRARGVSEISGTIRYEVFKAARYRCELCGISAEERALQVDHIIPRNHGGTDDISNFQALCFSCNATKRDTDDADLRAVRASYKVRDPSCPFCSVDEREVLLHSPLAFVVRDKFPVSSGHLLVIPRRHVADYFDLGSAEARSCDRLVREARKFVLRSDATIAGFNVGINSGGAAGQTVMHCHIHLIPRRSGDVENPRGGVRGVIAGRADYT